MAENERREQALQRQISQRKRPQGTAPSDEVPFGIRAIESGIEVEGVWISRPNTPEKQSRQSSAGSLILQQYPCRSNSVDVERGLPVSPAISSSPTDLHSGSKPANFCTNSRTSVFGQTSSAERLSSSKTSRNPSPDALITRPPRTRHPPCSYSKYSTSPYLHRHSSTISALEGLEAIHRASTSINTNGGSGSGSSSSESSSGGEDNGSISAAAPGLLSNAQPSPHRRQPSLDLQMLDTHRISQAAETGQLTPKVRRPGQSRESSVASLPTPPSMTISGQHDCLVTLQQPLPTLPSGGSSPINPFSSPKIDALPPAVRRSSMPDVTPFAKFCATAPPSPRPEGYRPLSQECVTNVRKHSEASSMFTTASLMPLASNPPTPPTQAEQGIAQPKRASFEKQASQVIRGFGSGFEILKPGSLNPPMPAEHPMERQRAAPPISLYNAYRPRSSSADSRRKLQKRRPSMDSTNSSDTGPKSGNSGF